MLKSYQISVKYKIYIYLSIKYSKKWEKISSVIGKEFDSEVVYGDSDKYIKTKIKSYGYRTNTNFQVDKILK